MASGTRPEGTRRGSEECWTKAFLLGFPATTRRALRLCSQGLKANLRAVHHHLPFSQSNSLTEDSCKLVTPWATQVLEYRQNTCKAPHFFKHSCCPPPLPPPQHTHFLGKWCGCNVKKNVDKSSGSATNQMAIPTYRFPYHSCTYMIAEGILCLAFFAVVHHEQSPLWSSSLMVAV